eukprot:g17157.t1
MSGDDRVLLADVKILHFTRGKRTTHRRVNAVKQLICDDSGPIGCPNKKEYLFESATCINEGIGENMMPSWSCTASSLPKDTELGSVNVSCEGYTYRDDPYVLAGSCAMEYTLTAPTPQGPFAAVLVFFAGLFACCACGRNRKKKPRGGLPPAYHEASTLGQRTAGHAPTPPPAGGLPTAHAVHMDDLEKNASGSVGKTGAVATAHPLGTTAAEVKPSGTSKTSVAAGAAAGAAATAAAAAGVAALASHNKNRKSEDQSLPEGWESQVDPLTKKTFYLNHDTRETTWVDPRKPSGEQQPLLPGHNTHSGVNWWNPMAIGNRMRLAPIRGGLNAWQNYGHAGGSQEESKSSTYQGATTSGRGGSSTHGGTSGRGNDHTSTAHGGTSGRAGGGSGHSSTAHGGTTGRGGGGGGSHSSTAHGGSSGR